MASANISLSQHGKKGKKKKKMEDVGKKLPKIFHYLFHKGGLEGNNVKQESDGWVYVDNILDIEACSDYVEEDVFETLSGSNNFELKMCPESGLLMVRSISPVEADAHHEEIPVNEDLASVKKDFPATGDVMLTDKSKSSKKKRRKKKSKGDHGDSEGEEAGASLQISEHVGEPPTGRMEARHVRHGAQGDDVFVSKTLSWLLRHGAIKSGFELQEGGFLYVDEVLQLPKFKNRFTGEDIKRIVETNEKQRFFMEPHPENGKLRIRANQGHSMQVEGLELTSLTLATEVPAVLHGTYTRNWPSIKQQGLKRMRRAHIHFAPGEPKDSGVISGMRGSCDVLIFVDLAAALQDGYKFFISANNVILCPGDDTGCLPPKYFTRVIDRQSRQSLL